MISPSAIKNAAPLLQQENDGAIYKFPSPVSNGRQEKKRISRNIPMISPRKYEQWDYVTVPIDAQASKQHPRTVQRTYSESGGIGIGQVQHPMEFGIRKAPGRNTRMSSLFFRETSIVGNPITESDSEELTNRGLEEPYQYTQALHVLAEYPSDSHNRTVPVCHRCHASRSQALLASADRDGLERFSPFQDYLALNAGATTDDRTLADNTMTPEEAQGSTSTAAILSIARKPRLAPTVPPSIGTASDSTRLISVRSAHLAVRPVRNSALPISAGLPPSNSRYAAASRTLAYCLTRCAFFVGVCAPEGPRTTAAQGGSLVLAGVHTELVRVATVFLGAMRVACSTLERITRPSGSASFADPGQSPASQQPHGARCAAQNPSSLAFHLSFNLGAAYVRLSQSATNSLEPIFSAIQPIPGVPQDLRQMTFRPVSQAAAADSISPGMAVGSSLLRMVSDNPPTDYAAVVLQIKLGQPERLMVPGTAELLQRRPGSSL
ncbi:hypothetical protein C8J57DRAFT_1664736 [Mycena rebaudengoi]|nr:hypothetical protein C8J57DRAFT_1664736 [Mycena rebaudengoi]